MYDAMIGKNKGWNALYKHLATLFLDIKTTSRDGKNTYLSKFAWREVPYITEL